MAKVRIPLQVDVKNRNDEVAKDSIITNGFIEQTTSNKLYTVKRPGLDFIASGAGTAQGTFHYIDKVYVWDSSKTATTPWILTNYGTFWSSYSLWNIGTTYLYNSSPVIWDDDTPGVPAGTKKIYYPATTSTGVPPTTQTSPGNIYWGTTPFSGTTYYGHISSNGPTSNDKISAAYSAWVSFISYRDCASAHPDTGLWTQFSGVGSGVYGADTILVQQWVSYMGNCQAANQGIAGYGYVVTL